MIPDDEGEDRSEGPVVQLDDGDFAKDVVALGDKSSDKNWVMGWKLCFVIEVLSQGFYSLIFLHNLNR